MRKKTKYLFIFIFLEIIQTNQLKGNPINPKSSSSSIRLKPQAHLTIKNPITKYKGKIIKGENSTIEGSNIDFVDGILEDNGNKINIYASLAGERTNKIILDGNKRIRSKKGNVLQTIEVSQRNNRIEGIVLTRKNIKLQDINSTLTVSIANELPANIELNTGTLYLEESLKFSGDKKIIGPGTVIFNDSKLILGNQDSIFKENLYFDNKAIIEINSTTHIQSTWTFSCCNSVISANNNIIFLDEIGEILVEKGSTLTIKNAILICINGNNLACLDNNGKIIFNNVILIPTNDYSFKKGSFEILGTLELTGPHTFAYQSPKASTIAANSSLILDDNITFSYDPAITNKSLIILENETSNITIDNATLHTTSTGLQLTKGSIIFSGDVNLSSEKTIHHWQTTDPEDEDFIIDHYLKIDGGISFGANESSQDLKCKISNGTNINLLNGSLKYKNINDSSWQTIGKSSTLNIYTQSNLQLHQSLNLKNCFAQFYRNSILSKYENKKLIGPIEAKGKFIKNRL